MHSLHDNLMSSSDEWDDGSNYAENPSNFTWIMVSFFLLSVADCILVLVALYGFYSEPNPILSLSNKQFKRIAIVALCVSGLFGWLVTIAWYIVLYQDRWQLAKNISVVAIGLYVTNLTLVILLFGFRLIYTFKNTVYAMKSRLKFWLIGMVITNVISLILCGVFFAVSSTSIGAFILAFVQMFCIINGIVLLIIYINKLNYVINDFLKEFGALSGDALNKLNKQLSEAYATGQMESIKTNSDDNNNNDNNNDNNNNNGEMFDLNRIISDMTRFSILIGVAAVSTVLIMIILVILSSLKTLSIYFAPLTLIDVIVNNICLILQFKMSRKFYKKFCICFIDKCQERQTKQINESISKMNLMSSVSLKRLDSGDIGLEIIDVQHNKDKDKDKDEDKSDGDYINSVALTTMHSVSVHSDQTQ